MLQTPVRNSILLALAGLFSVAISAIYLIMLTTDGLFTFHSSHRMAILLGELGIAAGVCAIAAGIGWSATGPGSLLILNGLALVFLGVLQYGFTRLRISFLTVALLIAVMALSMGALEWMLGRALRREGHNSAGWFLSLAFAASLGFTAVFFALGFRWITMSPASRLDLLWLGLYFAFSAVSFLILAFESRRQGRGDSEPQSLPPATRPRHAH